MIVITYKQFIMAVYAFLLPLFILHDYFYFPFLIQWAFQQTAIKAIHCRHRSWAIAWEERSKKKTKRILHDQSTITILFRIGSTAKQTNIRTKMRNRLLQCQRIGNCFDKSLIYFPFMCSQTTLLHYVSRRRLSLVTKG